MKISTASEFGLRDYQEDRYVVHPTAEGTFLAIMDGHGGEDVADVCRDYAATFWDLSTKDRPPTNALELVIWELDAITNEYHSGCTISLAFVPKSEEFVYFATLGDSPVIVRSPDGVTHVSTSHNVRSNHEERDAAIRRGGLYYDGYIWSNPERFSMSPSGLQMARSLGDSNMGPVRSSKPDVETHKFGDFLLLATDGVFDPAHQDELKAASDVIALIERGGTAQDIVDRAVKLPTEDNATAILITKEPTNG